MTAEWTLPLLIVVPLLGAAVALAAGRITDNGGYWVAAAVLTAEAVIAGRLIAAVYSGERIVYQVGGAALSRPEGLAIGIELLADTVSVFLLPLIVGVAGLLLPCAVRAEHRTTAFYSVYLLLTGGLMGVVLTHDIFNLFVFLEITGLATYALVASGRSKVSAVAALKYLMIGTVGASCYLIGVGYLYMVTGTLNMTDLAQVLAGDGFIQHALYTDPLVVTGFAFMATGLMVKAAIFPLHTWQPDAYETAPDDVSAYIAALVSTAGAYALARLMFTVFTPEFFAATPVAAEIVIGLAAISIVAGSLLAAMQHRVKRMLAYSSVAQFGMIVAAFGIAAHPAGGSTALTGGIIHLTGHGVLKAGLFLAASVIAARHGARTIQEYAGMGERFPIGAAGVALLGLALAGMPPSIGFVGKWYIAVGAVSSGLWPVAAVIVLSTVLTLLYIARLLEQVYVTSADIDTADSSGYPVQLAAVLGLAVLAVVLGFAGNVLYDLLAPFVSEVYAP